MFWFFGPKAYEILAPQPGIERTPSALEVEALTTGPPKKSLFFLLFLQKTGHKTVKNKQNLSFLLKKKKQNQIPFINFFFLTNDEILSASTALSSHCLLSNKEVCCSLFELLMWAHGLPVSAPPSPPFG